MKLRHREIARALQETIDYAQQLLRDHEAICLRANTDADDGIAGINYSGDGRSSGHSDPVGNRAGRRDLAGDTAKDFKVSVYASLREMRVAARKGWALLPLPADEADKLASAEEIKADAYDPTRSATCANQNCQRVVARTPNDRLREGRCENCYRYRREHGEERPRLYCDAERNIASAFELDPERVMVEDVA